MIKKVKDPGFGYQSSKNAKKIINQDGTSNVTHVNRTRNWNDLYSHLIDISWTRFFFFVILVYTSINILFAVIYNRIGIEQMTASTGNVLRDLLNVFFFSAQTITRVGYGGIAPQGLIANIIASFQAMIGLLGFSFITGLLYGRFSKPKAAIKFSKNIIVRDFKDNRALMFHLMNSIKNMMIEPQITATLSITEPSKKGDNFKRNFYQLKIERDKIMYLPTMWTVVHLLDEKSPLQSIQIKN